MNDRVGPQWVRPAVATPGALGLVGGMFKLTNVADFADYVLGRTWDGENQGDTDIALAKPIELQRQTLAEKVVGGIFYNYTSQPGHMQRIVKFVPGGKEQIEVIIRPYRDREVVHAIRGWVGGTLAVDDRDPENPVAIPWLIIETAGKQWGLKDSS